MNLSDYKAEYAAYRRALERERYRQHVKSTAKPNLQPLGDRFADLWTPDAIRMLQQVWIDMAAAHLETERSGVDALINHARRAKAEAQASDVTDELDHCEADARIEWNEAPVALRRVPSLMVNEVDHNRRRELQARWFDRLRTCDDLRAMRFEIRRAAATTAAAAARPSTDHEQMSQADSGIISSDAEIIASAQSFLERTSSAYLTQLADWIKNNLPGTTASKLTFADSLFFKRAKQLDPVFDAPRKCLAAYQKALGNLGISVDRQNNIHFDSVSGSVTDRSTNDSPESVSVNDHQTRCYGINPPSEVRVVHGTTEGLPGFLEFFRETGLAQYFGWLSSDLVARHPEFIYVPDRATAAGFAQFFSNLSLDAAWLAEHRALRLSEARAVSRFVALIALHDLRAICAESIHQSSLEAGSDVRAELLATNYATLLTESTGFTYDPAMYLYELENRIINSKTNLRAHAFAVALDERLRTRYGHNYWASGAAADELIDMWNTGSRYSVEELAKLTGIGALDYNLLTERMIQLVNGE